MLTPKKSRLAGAIALILIAAAVYAQRPPAGLDAIQNIVVIFAENRSFDVLYGAFPGANGWTKHPVPQRDRDGSVMKELPPIWRGLTAAGVTPPVTEAQTAHLANQPFGIDAPGGFNQSMNVVTRDLYHRFYENQMQIDGGKNDRFVAWADSGALVMGHYDGSSMNMWKVARENVLADNFFMGAFGGSFLNHIWLICACVPLYPHADHSPAAGSIADVESDGVTLKLAPNSPRSAIDGPPRFLKDGNLTPDFYAVNTMQPPYQPSANKPAKGGDPAFADPEIPTTLPPQTAQTIGDLLTAKGRELGLVRRCLAGGTRWEQRPHGAEFPVSTISPSTISPPWRPARRHAPNISRMADSPAARFSKPSDAGKLEQVTFYKPQGNLNEHAGYADVAAGDAHIADVIAAASERVRSGATWW